MEKEMKIIVPVGLEGDWPTCESIVRDILKQYHNFGFTCFALAGPGGGWRPIGYPPMEQYNKLAELFLEVKNILAPYGIECGWWNCATIKSGPSDEFTSVTWEDGSPHAFANCPLDENFKKRFSEDIARFAKIAKPAFIITEDDFSVVAAGGCFCDNHLKAFEKKMGQYYSREQLQEILWQNKPENFEIIRKWRENLKDSMVGLAEAMRRELDKESPEIPMIYCQAGCADMEGDCTEAVARAMAGPRHSPTSRLYGAGYGITPAKGIPTMLYHTLYNKQHVGDDFTCLHEIDTYPHTRFYNAASYMGTVMGIVSSYGYDGAIFQTQQILDDAGEETAYGNMYAEGKVCFNTVNRIAKQCHLKGVEIDYDPFWNTVVESKSTKDPLWVECISRFGIPYVTTQANVAFWDDRQAKYAEHDVIMEYLSKGLFLDADAAKVLCERGYGKYLGVEVGDSVLVGSKLGYDLGAREVIRDSFARESVGRHMPSPHMYSPSGNGVQLRLTVTDDACEVISDLYTFQREYVAPVMTRFENEFGGKVVVMGVTLDKNRSHSLYNYRRMRLFKELLTWCSDEYVFVKGEPDVCVIQNEAKNRTESGCFGMLTLANLSADPLDEISLHLPPAWKELTEFYILTKDGEWEMADFSKNEDGIILHQKLNHLDPLYVLAK